jgi:transmembrane sensor
MASVNQEIDNRAAAWATKRNLGVLTPEEDAVFETWLAADIRHLGAYGRAEAVLARLERIPGSAIVGLRADEAPTVWTRRRVVLSGSIAASIAAAFVGGAALWQSHQNETFATGIGQVREVVLADGSIVTLNTNSSVTVNYTKDRRNIHLVRGEALFDVAKNKHRPFIVLAGDMLVRAVGTSFTVSMLPQRPIQVLVKEGVVELARISAPRSASVRVSANTQVLMTHDVPIVAAGVPKAKIERDTAWQFGRIAFDNQTLRDAAQEFSRYSDVRIVVDSSAANRTVTGLFVANDPVGFAKAAALVLRLQVAVSDREVRLFDGDNAGGVGKL